MQVTQVAIRPTLASDAAGRPALTPELLAASGARYSRNNEGLAAILSKIDPNNLDKSVDGIFRMVDYGHASIADIAPVAMFLDGLSLWLAYHVWTLVPTAGGQESSTRYIQLSPQSVPSADELGIAPQHQAAWRQGVAGAFEAYREALALWENIAARMPDVTRIPRALRDDPSDKAQKAVARMRRNYAFDRARVFLPVCAQTNVMLVMSARGWVGLCQQLLSHALPEAQKLGELVREELGLAAPRLLRHAVRQESLAAGLREEVAEWRRLAKNDAPYLQADAPTFDHPPQARLEVFAPPGVQGEDFTHDLRHHDNRYAHIGPHLRRTVARFGWDAVAFGEIRDLNRHRTGTKYCPFAPVGFYACLDQLPPGCEAEATRLRELSEAGRAASSHARSLLAGGEDAFVYFPLLGTQFPFEHTTTADKFLYEAELRTGTGAHFRYARHLHDALALWFEQFPQTRGLVLEGSAEPE